MLENLNFLDCTKGQPFKYVLTDFNEDNIHFYMKCPMFQSFIKEGWLDFAILNAEDFTSLNLLCSNEIISNPSSSKEMNPSTNINPFIVIANYIFDTLKQDAFQIVDSKLYEVKCIVEGLSHSLLLSLPLTYTYKLTLSNFLSLTLSYSLSLSLS